MRYTFDTNVAIAAIRQRAERERFTGFVRAQRGRVLLHASVWLELQVGVRTADEQSALDEFVAPFVEANRTIVPSRNAWRQAGRLLQKLATADSEDPRRSAIHHDAIIAASVREGEVTLVTRNAADFARLARYLSKLRYIPPYP